ncbi:hypothetical protein [Streptomyces sp. NBC_00829]|uniref:hypothetical protein n=1 Tax=Streptomyces sp. NBC_00829 TaxID=2903679 RepID=UPI00386FEE6C|nr:hypothetical protein OG293_29820 [Streptomyces sp. NBC_00829]
MSTEAHRPPGPPASPRPEDGDAAPGTSRITDALVPQETAPSALRTSGITQFLHPDPADQDSAQRPSGPPPRPCAPPVAGAQAGDADRPESTPEVPPARAGASRSEPFAPPRRITPPPRRDARPPHPSAADRSSGVAPPVPPRPDTPPGRASGTRPAAVPAGQTGPDTPPGRASGTRPAAVPAGQTPAAPPAPSSPPQRPDARPATSDARPARPATSPRPSADIPPARPSAAPGPAGSRPPTTARPATSAPTEPPRPAAGSVPPVETTARLRPVGDPRSTPEYPGPRSTPEYPGPPPATAPPAPEPPPRPPVAPTRRRPVGSVDLTPPPPGSRPAHPGPALQHWAPPETPAETTTRLRPVRTRRTARTVGALACVVLGLGLIGGAATGSWLTGNSSADSADRTGYTEARALWHSVPVDTLFPRTLKGTGAGPGGADRVWTRIAVAPDGPCAPALERLLAMVLQPVGCVRVLRATYTDATASSVTTVGMIFTEGDPDAMRALSTRFSEQGLDERPDLMPRALPARDTIAARFGDRQRASWTVSVLTEMPVIVYAVSGFADGRTVTDPQSADEAKARGATSAPAQAGLGHEALGIADRIEDGLRRAISPATGSPE